MKLPQWVFAVISLLLLVFAAIQLPPNEDVDDVRAIHLLILSDLVRMTSREVINPNECIFVSLGEQGLDLPDEDIRKLQRIYPYVFQGSRCIHGDQPKDSITGMLGIALYGGSGCEWEKVRSLREVCCLGFKWSDFHV